MNDDGLTLATLCDMVLGEDAVDRSNNALVRAVGLLVRKAAQQSVQRTVTDEDDPHGEAALQERLDQERDNPFGW